MRPTPHLPATERLEPRRLLAAAAMNPYEQYMLELLNRARHDPVEEAARFDISLNEGLPSDTLNSDPRQPLAPNAHLTSAARKHGDWLLDQGQFSHTGAGGSSPGQRMAAEGYVFRSPSGSSENLAVKLNSSPLPLTTAIVEDQHRKLFIDAGIEGRGHRKNILRGVMKEVGVGYSDSDSFRYSGRDLNAQLSTQNFAYSHASGEHFLTGVAYTDTVRDDDFYTPGEQLAGLTVVAVRGDGLRYEAATAAAGGWAIRVPEGTYTVTATGTSLGGTVTYEGVRVDGRNVKLDFTPDRVRAGGGGDAGGPAALPGWLRLTDGRLRVSGTNGGDAILFTPGRKSFNVYLNGEAVNVLYRDVAMVEVLAGDGNDTVDAFLPIPVYANGGRGDDVLAGGRLGDTLTGGDGNDQIVGRDGDDLINGNAGRDALNGGDGRDTVNGHDGNDTLLGGRGNDALDGQADDDLLLGGDDADTLLGGSGDDKLYGQRGDDVNHGGRGRDLLAGSPGADYHDGGPDRDLLSYEVRTNAVWVSPTSDYRRQRGNDGEVGEGDHVLDSVEVLVGGSGNDTLAGTDWGDAVLYGNAGDDLLFSRNDRADLLFGGDGDDTAEADEHDVIEL